MISVEMAKEALRTVVFLVLALATLASAYAGGLYWARQGSTTDAVLSLLVPGYGAVSIWSATG